MQRKSKNPLSFLNKIILILLIITWSSCIWEVGLEFFVSRYGVSIFRLFSILFILFYILSLIIEKKDFKIYFPFEVKIFLLYIIGNLVTLTYSSNISLSLHAIYINFYYFVLMLLSLHFFQSQNRDITRFFFKRIGYITLIIMLGISLYLAVTLDISFIRPTYSGKFTISAFQDYNVMTVSLLMAASLIMVGEKVNAKTNILFLSLILLVVSVGVMSGSRRSIVLYLPIVLLVSQFFIFKANKKNYFKTLFYVIVLFLTVFVLVKYNTSSMNLETKYLAVENRVERGLSFFNENNNMSDGRIAKWEKAIILYNNYSIKKLIFGNGYLSYLDSKIMQRENGIAFSPHNFVLSSLLNGGVIVLLIVLMLIFSLFLAYFQISSSIDAWSRIFILSFLFIWVVSVSISGSDFLATRQIYLFVLFLLINRYITKINKQYKEIKQCYDK